MSKIRTLVMLIAIVALGGSASVGQETAPPPSAPKPPPSETPPTAQTPPSTPRPPAPAAQRTPNDADIFIPSEELSADEVVTFPVDI